MTSFSFYFNPHLGICVLILEREEGIERKIIDVREKHHSVATCNILVHHVMFHLSELLGQGCNPFEKDPFKLLSQAT